jgi:hypothetical protein
MKVEIPQLIDVVAEIYEITSNDIIEGKRTKVITSARKALIIGMIILGYDYRDFGLIIPKSRTMPLHYKGEGESLFRLDKSFRAIMKLIFHKLKQNDKFEQFAKSNPYRTFIRNARCAEKNTIFTQDNTASESNKSSKLFNFTPEEEIAISRAIKESKMYFEKYGKGYTPDHILMVNKKRYDN